MQRNNSWFKREVEGFNNAHSGKCLVISQDVYESFDSPIVKEHAMYLFMRENV